MVADIQDIPDGYKRTDVGVIPEDWNENILSDVSDIKTGPFGSSLHKSDYVEEGTPIITVEHLGELGITTQNLPLVSDEDKKRLSAYKLRTGDIVFSRVGSVDRNAIVSTVENGWLFSGRLLRVRSFNGAVDSKFLSQQFHTTTFKERVLSVAVGQTMASLNTKILGGVKVGYPSDRKEQTVIAEALTDADEAIRSLEAVIVKKRDVKQAALHALLTPTRRLPAFSGEWKVKKLGDYCIFENGDRGFNYPSKSDFIAEGHPFINAGHIGNGKINTQGIDFISSEHFNRLRGGKYLKNDILFCLRGSLGKFGVVKEENEGGAIASSLIVIRARNEKVTTEFLSQYFKTNKCSEMIEFWSGGAAQPNLGGRELANFEISLPPQIDEQVAITTVLSDMDAEIEKLETRLDKLRDVKQGMMQVLLTGKVRLI